ncbi:MAG: hypothetical protein RQ875_11125 [Vicingaceae bacterium]|nr:hypothetical protein [Vicingaceae bacterium]
MKALQRVNISTHKLIICSFAMFAFSTITNAQNGNNNGNGGSKGNGNFYNGKVVDEVYKNNPLDPITVKGVNLKRLKNFGDNLKSNPGRYTTLFRNCSTQCARALRSSGIMVTGGHPYLLYGELFLRQIGIRPMMYSFYLTK